MNMDMVMNMEPSRGQVRHGVLARFTEHCIFTLFPGAFVGFVIQKEFFGIFLGIIHKVQSGLRGSQRGQKKIPRAK